MRPDHNAHVTTPEFSSISDTLTDIKRGKMIVLVDDEDRENEGDLVIAADYADASAINFMIKHGRGLVCTTITAERARQLGLKQMVAKNDDAMSTAFTVSVDGTARHGISTGISAVERAKTVEILVKGNASDLVSPGHMFPLVAKPGGTAERHGHTEASVDLARLAGLAPAAVIVEIIGDDGRMMRRDKLADFAKSYGLRITSIELLRRYLVGRG